MGSEQEFFNLIKPNLSTIQLSGYLKYPEPASNQWICWSINMDVSKIHALETMHLTHKSKFDIRLSADKN